MNFHHQSPPPPFRRQEPKDTRGKTTRWIWFWSAAMMWPASLSAAATDSVLVPLGVVAVAGISSASVWLFGGRALKREQHEEEELRAAIRESAQLRAKVGEMEERLFALETMDSYEKAARQRAAEQQAYAPRDPLLPDPPQRRGQRPGVMDG